MYEKKRIKLSSRPTMKSVTLNDVRKSRAIFNDAVNAGKDFINNKVDKVTENYSSQDKDLSGLPNAGALVNAVSGNTMTIDSASFSNVFSNKGRMDTLSSSDVLFSNLREIALLSSLSAINGLPPVPDNVVDPPVEIMRQDIQAPIESWKSRMVGRDYVKRVLSNGQFLVLVPIELQPRNFGALGEGQDAKKLSNYAGSLLGKIEGRLDVTSYGFHSKVNSFKYWKAVQAHFKTALIALGIQSATENREDATVKALFSQYLPDELVDKVLTSNTNSMFSRLAGGNGDGEQGDANAYGDTTSLQNKIDDLVNAINSNNIGETLAKAKIGNETTQLSTSDMQKIAVNSALANVLKWVTNVDVTDEVLLNMPFTIYYCNGPVERSTATSTELGESTIAKMTTDLVGKGATAAIGALLNKAPAISAMGVDSGTAEEYIKELAYHGGFGTMIVANTWIPKVIKNSLLNQSYTVNIKESVASSDRFSKARVQWTLCQLIPYVIPTNEPGQPLLMPRTTMYCSASVKGVMNLPRAAITSMSVRTSPEFQTSEGIPTELDISLTIQPLYDLSAMPDFDKWYNGASEPINLAASMYNPQSSFNLIATMCGQNTTLTKFNAGMLDFFVNGTIDSVVNSVKNTGNTVSMLWRDFKSSGSGTRTSIMSTLRLL